MNGWVRELLTGGCDWLWGWGWAGGAVWAVMHASQGRNRMRLLTHFALTAGSRPLQCNHPWCRLNIGIRFCPGLTRLVDSAGSFAHARTHPHTHTHSSLHCTRWRLSVQPRVTTLAWCLQPLKFGAAAVNIHYHPINTQFVVRLMLSGADDRGCDPEVQGQWEGRVSRREVRGSNKVTVGQTSSQLTTVPRCDTGVDMTDPWPTSKRPSRFDWQGLEEMRNRCAGGWSLVRWPTMGDRERGGGGLIERTIDGVFPGFGNNSPQGYPLDVNIHFTDLNWVVWGGWVGRCSVTL